MREGRQKGGTGNQIAQRIEGADRQGADRGAHRFAKGADTGEQGEQKRGWASRQYQRGGSTASACAAGLLRSLCCVVSYGGWQRLSFGRRLVRYPSMLRVGHCCRTRHAPARGEGLLLGCWRLLAPRTEGQNCSRRWAERNQPPPHSEDWKVRLMTSSCCSRVRRWKCTA